MIVRLTKLKEVENPLHPNNIPEGWSKDFETTPFLWREPTIGERFNPCSYFSTSGVLEIIDEKTFKTYSSIYQWEILEK